MGNRNGELKWAILEKVLFEWQLERESREAGSSNDDLLDAAKETWREEKLPEDQKKDPKAEELLPDPGLSLGWLTGFKKRLGMKLRKQHGEVSIVPRISHDEMKRISLLAKTML